jgi:hypothetical protein
LPCNLTKFYDLKQELFRREKTNFFGKAKKTKTLAELHQKTNG